MDKVTWNIDAERDLWRAICAPGCWHGPDGITPATHPKSLWWFNKLAWGIDFYFKRHPEQPVWFVEHIHGPYLNWLQTHILRWKAYCLAGGTDRYYIASVLPRGFGKTVTSSKSAMIWAHLDEPDMSTLIASATSDLAQDIYKAIQAVISGESEDSWFSWLYGNWKKGAKEWTKEHLQHGYRKSANLSEPSFDVTSVDSGMTGYHHRIHNWDDPIYANKLREGREAYMRSVHTAVDASFNALQSNGLLMFTLTRYLDDDVAGRHFRNEGIATWSGMDCPHTMMFDKVAFGKGAWHVYFMQVEDELTGEPTHPTLMDRKKIEEAKKRDPEDFANQYQNNPGSGDRAPIIESQLSDIFMDYRDFLFTVPVEYATVHIDTAFKTKKTVGKGDDSAIVVWKHDARRNGIIYLDTDKLRCSSEWREEDFNTQLVKVFIALRRDQCRVAKLTDEMEIGGKAGSYKNRLISVLTNVGINLSPDNFLQINRTNNKRARIRVALGYWVEGYVRILLHKDSEGKWIIPPIVRKLFSQALRVDVVEHDDLMDAASDGFLPGIWRRPQPRQYAESDEGAYPIEPGDEYLKSLARKMTNQELYDLIDANKEQQENFGDGLRGWTVEDYETLPPREPV